MLAIAAGEFEPAGLEPRPSEGPSHTIETNRLVEMAKEFWLPPLSLMAEALPSSPWEARFPW
jgi:hypothetical protein